MEKLYDNEKFAAVWSRVMPNQPEEEPAPPAATLTQEDKAALLRALINGKAQNLACYTLLAKRYRGKSPGKLFGGFARDEAAHLRNLQTAHYLLTGDTCVPQAEPVRIASVLSVLRLCYLRERDGEKTFILASLQDDEPKRTQLYTRIADEAARHALLLETFMEKSL